MFLTSILREKLCQTNLKAVVSKGMSEGSSIETHLMEMKKLTDKLSSIVSKDQVVTLLGSLPSSFSTVLTTLEARADDIIMDFVQQQLIHDEQKLKSQKLKPEALHDSALKGAQKCNPQSATPVTKLSTFKDFVQNRKRRRHQCTEQS